MLSRVLMPSKNHRLSSAFSLQDNQSQLYQSSLHRRDTLVPKSSLQPFTELTPVSPCFPPTGTLSFTDKLLTSCSAPNQCCWMGFLTQVQIFTCPLLKCSVPVFSFHQLVSIPLNGDTTIGSTNCSPPLFTFSRLTQVTHYSVTESNKTKPETPTATMFRVLLCCTKRRARHCHFWDCGTYLSMLNHYLSCYMDKMLTISFF